jgi:hypothetical protein
VGEEFVGEEASPATKGIRDEYERTRLNTLM